MFNTDENEIMVLGKISLYIVDKNNNQIYNDFAISKPKEFEKDVESFIGTVDGSNKTCNKKQSSSNEFEYDINDTEYKLKVILGCCMMKKKEYDSAIQYRCVGSLKDRMCRNN